MRCRLLLAAAAMLTLAACSESSTAPRSLTPSVHSADVNPNPLVWYHEFGGGRVFYSGIGHTSESYSEPYMVTLLTGGLAYAVGK